MNVSLFPLDTFQDPATAATHPAAQASTQTAAQGSAQAAPSTASDAETAKAAAAASVSKLSVNNQIHQLKEQGQTLSQISVDLDLSISAVGNDLLINVPKIPAITQTPPPNAAPSISLSA